MWCENLFAHGRVERRLAPVRAALGVIVITGMVAATSTVAQTPLPQPTNTPNAGQDRRTLPGVRPPLEERSYEDEFTFRWRTSFVRDPWTWGYTKEFAERFKMPAEWIEPEMRGVLAVAFRVHPFVRQICGLGGNTASCMPSYMCQLDVYLPSDVPLPWTSPQVRRDSLDKELTSAGFPLPFKPRREILDAFPNPLHPLYGRTGGELFVLRDGRPSGFASIRHFDRDYAPGVMLLGLDSCPEPRGEQSKREFRAYTREAWMTYQGGSEAAMTRNQHIWSGVIPKSFWDRADAVYKRDTAPADAALDRVTRDAVERLRPPAQQPQAVPAVPTR